MPHVVALVVDAVHTAALAGDVDFATLDGLRAGEEEGGRDELRAQKASFAHLRKELHSLRVCLPP